jgi:hypothetical protein
VIITICVFCGEIIGQEFPVPVARLEFTPIIPHVPGITPNKLGTTILTDRLCCQGCYKKIQENDFLAIEEASQMPKGK